MASCENYTPYDERWMSTYRSLTTAALVLEAIGARSHPDVPREGELVRTTRGWFVAKHRVRVVRVCCEKMTERIETAFGGRLSRAGLYGMLYWMGIQILITGRGL